MSDGPDDRPDAATPAGDDAEVLATPGTDATGTSSTGADATTADGSVAAAATTAKPVAGGVRRLTDADAKGRGLRVRRTSAEDEAALPESRPLWQNGAIVIGAFAASTGIAEVAGATNFGTALSFGQIGFAISLVYVLIRR